MRFGDYVSILVSQYENFFDVYLMIVQVVQYF